MSGKDQKTGASGQDPKVKSEDGGAASTDEAREEPSSDELSTKYKDLIKKYNLLVERLKRSDARRDQLKTELADLEGVKNEESNRAVELRVNLESLEAQNADLLEELGAANRLIATGLEEEINDIMATGGGPIPSKVPTFSGDTSADGNAAALWLSNLESMATGKKWTDNQTLSNAILALSGDAGEWRWSEQHDNADWFKDLNLFKENFKKRFCKAKTAVEAVKILSGLNQKQSESVRTFYDRCNNAVWLSSDDDFTKAKTLWKNGEADKDISREEKAYTRHLSWTVRCNFVNGLRPSIRAIIESKCKHLLIKCLQTGEDFQEALSAWRTIPREDKLSPYEILFSKKTKMHLPSLTAKNADPISLAAKDKASQRTVSYFNRRTKPLSIFEPGDHVTMRHHATGRWDTDGIILTRRPDGYSYIIQTKNGQEFLRGRRWLKSRRPERNTPMRIQHPRSNLQFDHEVTQLNNRHNSPNLRRSERIRNCQSK